MMRGVWTEPLLHRGNQGQRCDGTESVHVYIQLELVLGLRPPPSYSCPRLGKKYWLGLKGSSVGPEWTAVVL